MKTKKSAAFNFGRKGYVIIILSLLTTFLYTALINDSLNIMLPAFEQTRGLSQTVLYGFSTIGTVVSVITAILWGNLLHKKSVKLVWVLGCLGTGVFAFIWSTATNYVVYLIGYLCCYAGAVGSSTMATNEIVAHWFPKKRGLAMGIVTCGFPVSAAITSTICNTLVSTWGTASFYIVMGICHLVIALIVGLFVKDYPEEAGAYPDNDKDFDLEQAKKELEEGLAYTKTSKWTVKKVLATPRTWQLWFGMGVLAFLSMGIMTNYTNKGLEFGYSIEELLLQLMLAGLLAIPGSIFMGFLDVKIGMKKCGIITYLLGILAIVLMLTHIRPLHYIALPFFSIMMGGASNMNVSAITAIWGRYDFENAFRVIQPMGTILSGVGISFVGMVGTSIGYVPAYIACLCLGIAGFLVFLTLKVEPIDADTRR